MPVLQNLTCRLTALPVGCAHIVAMGHTATTRVLVNFVSNMFVPDVCGLSQCDIYIYTCSSGKLNRGKPSHGHDLLSHVWKRKDLVLMISAILNGI